MNTLFRKTVHLLLLVAFLVVAVTGIMKVAEYRSHALGEVHEISGLTLVGLALIHIYIYRRAIVLMLKPSRR